MSSSPDNTAFGPVRVTLTCPFPGAQVQLIDGGMRLVGRASNSLELDVLPGIYKARVIVGEAALDRCIVVRPNIPFSDALVAPRPASAMPLEGTATSHEYHQDAARMLGDLEATLQASPDAAAICVLIREWTQEQAIQPDRAPLDWGLRVHATDQAHSIIIPTSPGPAGPDRVGYGGISVDAGFYRFASGASAVELPVYALAGWATEIYLMADLGRDGPPAPDLARASIIWSRPEMRFDPQRRDLLVLASLRTAIESGRRLITDEGLRDDLYEKYHNPMLGLISAHALLRRKAIQPDYLKVVTGNLEKIVGLLPDVIALKLEIDRRADVPPVTTPPMLRSSWDLLLQHSVDRPDLIPRGSLLGKIADRVTGDGMWMSWVADDPNELDAKRGSRARAARRAWSRASSKAFIAPSLTMLEGLEPPAAGLDPGRRAKEQVICCYGIPPHELDDAETPDGVESAPIQSPGVSPVDMQKRKNFNERFLERLLRRRPGDRNHYQSRLAVPEAAVADFPVEEGMLSARDLALETIVNQERPVLFVKDGKFDTTEVTVLGPDATDLIDQLKNASTRLLPLLPLIGRIDVVNFPNIDFLGTGWFVDTDIVVTNRHVASLIAQRDGRQFVFRRGIGSQPISSSVCNAHEYDDLAPDSSRIFKVKEVLYIESEFGPDIAFLRVERRTNGTALPFITVAPSDAATDVPVCVIGYPARAPKRIIPDQALMNDLFRGRFDVKRAAPGYTMNLDSGSGTHDCSTLGGNSGSVVVELATGRAVGLHYSGVYMETNYAVRASVLTDYIRGKRWNTSLNIETRRPSLPATPSQAVPSTVPAAAFPAAAGAPLAAAQVGGITITLPLNITVSLGPPVSPVQPPTAPQPARKLDSTRAEDAVADFWDARPEGVIAVRVGYFDEDDRIGDAPCIAASVKPELWAGLAQTGLKEFQGVPVRYLPANIEEQVQAHPLVESVDSIAYDDDARTGERFSFSPVQEEMNVTLHVGPEYSWDVLKQFLAESRGRLVSAMYEFHGAHIEEAIEDRLKNGGSMSLVLDNATFSKVKDEATEFDRVKTFEKWANKYTFDRIVAPEGGSGLISDSYHIKVTIRDDDTFWLSSGNWKMGSSQPVITEEQRRNVSDQDLPGNREWHVVIKNKTLATRFRSHILQDSRRSSDLGGGPLPRRLMEEEVFVDIPIEEEAVVLERRAPSHILKPKVIQRAVKVQSLLTPDQEGAVYSEAVLKLIQSARQSLLFQIPYIATPSNPRDDRGYIDELLKALTRKLKSLDDARVILRTGGSRYSSPAHAGWYFKSKGVDIDSRLRVMENHHTKGMIVDGKRVLIGSHNWSKPGVSLNRDASLIFDDGDAAAYFTEAFEIDWERANRVRPKKYVKPEAVVLEAVGDQPAPGFRRVRLSELLKDD